MSLYETITKYLSENSESKEKLAEQIKKQIKEKIDKMKIDPKNKTSKEEEEKAQKMLAELVECLPLLDKQFYQDNLDFPIHIAFLMNDRNIDLYQAYKDNEQKNFDEIKVYSLQELSIQILKKVLAWGSKKEIVIFLNDVSELNTKDPETSLVLCEMYYQVIPQLEKKELFVNEILPQILKNIQVSLEKWGKNYFKQESKRKTQKFYKEFEKNLEIFVKKFITMLKNLPEIQKVSGIGNSKLLCFIIQQKYFILAISDLIEESGDSIEVLNKSPNPNLLLKHYVILFICDIYEGSMHTEKAFQEKTIPRIQQFLLDSLLDLHKNPIDYIETVVEYLNYFHYSNNQNKDLFKAYEPLHRYNVTAPAKLLVDLLKNKTFTLTFTPEYQIQLLLTIINEMFLVEEKVQQKIELIESLLVLLKQHKFKDIDNLNFFNSRMDSVLSNILDFLGGTKTSNEEQQNLLDIFPLIWDSLTKSAKYEFIMKLIPKTQNIAMIGFFLNKIYQEIAQDLRDPAKAFEDMENPFICQQTLEALFHNCLEKHQDASISEKSEIFSNIFNCMYFLIKKHLTFASNNNEKLYAKEFSKHILHVDSKIYFIEFFDFLKQIENEINQEIDGQHNSENSEQEEKIISKNSLILLKDTISKIQELNISIK